MALLRKINSRAKSHINSGFGVNPSSYGGRFLNKDGRANIRKDGISFLERTSWYHTMLVMPRWKFLLTIILFYVGINLAFAIVYFVLGMQSLGLKSQSTLVNFGEAFFFSTQTFTTVGYGRISPVGFGSSVTASFEALIGLLSFALATGLLYARFSKPVAHIRFSEEALISPYNNINALMIRLAPFKNNNLIDATANVTLGMAVEENGVKVNKFYQLDLEIKNINSLNLSWTIVHPINEKSPLYNFTKEDYENIHGEVLVFIKAFDDLYSNNVVARSSYLFSEIKYGAKFIPMYDRSASGNKTIIYIDKLNNYAEVELNGESSGLPEATARMERL